MLVEFSEDAGAERDAAVKEMARRLCEAHEGLRIGVRVAEPDSLPRFELKAKRLRDERVVWGSADDRKVM